MVDVKHYVRYANVTEMDPMVHYYACIYANSTFISLSFSNIHAYYVHWVEDENPNCLEVGYVTHERCMVRNIS